MDLTQSFEEAFPREILERYDLVEVSDAATILKHTSPEEFGQIVEVLGEFALTDEDFLKPGGQKSTVAARLDLAFRERGWREGRHDTKVTSILPLSPYAGEAKRAPVETEVVNEGYKVDNVKGSVALDVEWNAKDGNLDRDVSAYRALYDAGIITAAIIVTRTQEDLRRLGERIGRNPFGTTTTTNLGKLTPRMTRGDSGGCPLLAIAITARCHEAGDPTPRLTP